VLALHGWLDHAGSFERLAPLWPERHIIALDFPGHGHSEHLPASGTYHILDYVVWVGRLIHELGYPRIDLIGHSLGAAVASIVAGALPQSIERLLLVEGIGPLTESAEQQPPRLGAYLAADSRPRNAKRTYGSIAEVATLRQQATDVSHEIAELLVARNLI